MATAKTDNDEIIDFLMGKADRLSKPQQKKLDRMVDCDRLIKLYPRRTDVLNMLVRKYKLEYGEEQYSMRTAINDYQSTQIVFGATIQHSRDYHLDILLAQIEETRQAAKASGNVAVMAMCDKNKAAAIEKFLGDKDTPKYDELQVADQIYTADPKVLGLPETADDAALMRELEKLRKIPKRRGAEADTIDIGYTLEE